MNRFYEMVSEDGVLDQKPTLQGSTITMIISPKNSK